MGLLQKSARQVFNKWQYILGSKIVEPPFDKFSMALWKRVVATMPRHEKIVMAKSAKNNGDFHIDKVSRTFVSDVKTMKLDYVDELFAEAEKILAAADIEKMFQEKSGGVYPYRVDLIDPQPALNTIFTKFALQPRITSLIEEYMGIAPRLYETCVWYDRPTELKKSQDSQMWHRDPDDFIGVKMFVCLHDVKSENGPFSCVPGNYSKKLYDYFGMFRKYKTSRRLNDEEMNSFAPKEKWLRLTGAKGTIAFADTMLCWHKGEKPQEGHRFKFMCAYTSAVPRVEWQ